MVLQLGDGLMELHTLVVVKLLLQLKKRQLIMLFHLKASLLSQYGPCEDEGWWMLALSWDS